MRHATPAASSLPAAPVLEVEVAFAEELVLEAWEDVALVLALDMPVVPVAVADGVALAPMGAVD